MYETRIKAGRYTQNVHPHSKFHRFMPEKLPLFLDFVNSRLFFFLNDPILRESGYERGIRFDRGWGVVGAVCVCVCVCVCVGGGGGGGQPLQYTTQRVHHSFLWYVVNTTVFRGLCYSAVGQTLHNRIQFIQTNTSPAWLSLALPLGLQCYRPAKERNRSAESAWRQR